MIQKAFDTINKADIDALISMGVHEFKTLEYKLELPGEKDADKKEFLADVSSFANASGGDIIFGIKPAMNAEGKKTGDPEAVVPLVGTTPDQACLRLEESVRGGIDPRLRIQIKGISGWGDGGQGFVILLRVPRSFASPHMVTFKGTSRFFSRHSTGKYQLDVAEIRSAFMATDSQAERIKRFREERIGRIIADETPVTLSTPHRLVLHVIPVASFLNRERLDLTKDRELLGSFKPINAGGSSHRYNLDGYMTWANSNVVVEAANSYCQLFFDGAIEAVFSELLRARHGAIVSGGIGIIPSQVYETRTIEAVESYLKGYAELGLIGPIALSMAVLGCRGSCMYVGNNYFGEGHPIDRDAIILPDVLVEDMKMDVPQVMKPLFDSVWNACGFPRSFNYDEKGNWRLTA